MSDINPTKLCCICKTEKPLDDFSKCSRRKDGRDCRCKKCRRERYALLMSDPELAAKIKYQNQENRRKRRSTPEGLAKERARQKIADAKFYASEAGRKKILGRHSKWQKTPEGRKYYRDKTREERKDPIKRKKKLEQNRKWSSTPKGKIVKRRLNQQRRAREFNAVIGDPQLIVKWEESWRH